LTNFFPGAGEKSLLMAGASSPVLGICWALGLLELIRPVADWI